jgi:hypothetical protein
MIVAGAVALSLLHAPLQCTHDPDPTLRREDSPGDALWGLAMELRARHDDAGARDALRYLADHYPSSRYAAAARAELGAGSLEGGT